ncbi:hypothetical protein F4775DRAFT_443806 [Biscogniauxia sp. FL1348]|nr:hypothetical protein F4775DRAFT_443806 [Biscogniauxia sp. FL1348]
MVEQAYQKWLTKEEGDGRRGKLGFISVVPSLLVVLFVITMATWHRVYSSLSIPLSLSMAAFFFITHTPFSARSRADGNELLA